MTPQVLAIIMAVVLLVAVILLLRSYVLPEKYAVLWLVASVAGIVLSAWPALLDTISDFFGIEQPIDLLFVGAFFVILLLLMQISLELARTRGPRSPRAARNGATSGTRTLIVTSPFSATETLRDDFGDDARSAAETASARRRPASSSARSRAT